MRPLYLLLAVLGFVLPWSQFVPFLAEQGLDVPLVVSLLFVNPISSFFALDLIVTAVAVGLFGAREARRGVTGAWWAVAGTFAVGPSFGLPLLLFLREEGRR